MTTELVYIEGAAGRIESVWRNGGTGERAALLCHPHPLYGGSMHDGVLAAVDEALAEREIASLRFNFRGVGGSEGSYDRGIGEADDAGALLRWLHDTKGCQRPILAGYSFGGGVALRAASRCELPLERLILIAPARWGEPSATGERLPCPLILIQGALDRMVDPEANRGWAEGLGSPADVIEFAHADHFFGNALADIVTALGGRLN